MGFSVPLVDHGTNICPETKQTGPASTGSCSLVALPRYNSFRQHASALKSFAVRRSPHRAIVLASPLSPTAVLLPSKLERACREQSTGHAAKHMTTYSGHAPQLVSLQQRRPSRYGCHTTSTVLPKYWFTSNAVSETTGSTANLH